MDITVSLDPKTTALLVIDKQAGYFDRSLVKNRGEDLPDNSLEVLEAIDNFIESFRQLGLEVIWTKMIEDKELSPNVISSLMSQSGSSITRPGQPSFEIFGRVKPLKSEKIITKNHYNAFAHTDLIEVLKTKGIKTLVFVGGYATRCVLSSIVGANSEDFLVVVPRGLVINQASSMNEIPTLYEAVTAIFGLVEEPDKILSTLRHNLSSK